jgi:hypothetical protein
VVTVDLDVGAHAAQLLHEGEPRVEDVLRAAAGAGRLGEQHHQLGLQVRGEPGVGQRHDVHGAELTGLDPQRVGALLDHDAGRRSFSRGRVRSAGRTRSITTSPTGHRGRDRVGAGLDAVRAGLPRDRTRAGPRPRSRGSASRCRRWGAHGHEHPAQVLDLGLAGGVVDDRGAVGQGAGHDQVLRGTHAREVQRDDGTVQVAGVDVDLAVALVHLGAHRRQAPQVHVDGARADPVAAGQGDPGPADARHQGAEDADRRADAADGVARGVPARLLGGVDDAPCRRRGPGRPRRPGPAARPPSPGTSAMRGISDSSRAPSQSNPAAMSFSAEFFAPESRTVPLRAAPPRTTNTSEEEVGSSTTA